MAETALISEEKAACKSLPGWRRDLFILVGVQILLALICLKTVPRIYHDEPWEASLGHSLAYEGRLRHGIIEGWGGMDIHFVQNQVILPWFCAAFYRVAGFSIVTSRMASVLVSVIAIISIYGVMRVWFGRTEAIVIGLATIVYPWFFEITRRVRPEIYYTAFGWAGCWLLVHSLGTGKRWAAILAGLSAGLAVLSHPTGAILCFSLFVSVITWQKGITVRSGGRCVLYVLLGFSLTVLPYVIYVLWSVRDPGVNFLEQMQATKLQISFFSREMGRWRHFFQWPKGAPLATMLITAWCCTWGRLERTDNILAMAVVLFVVILPFATVNTTSRYIASITPAFCGLLFRMVFLIAGDVKRGWRQWKGKLRFALASSIAGVYVSMSLVAISLMFYHLHGADLDKVLDRIASVVEPGSRVYGEMIFWMERDRFEYGPYPLEYRDKEWVQDVESVTKYHFDYAVRTAWLWYTSHAIATPPEEMPAFRDGYTIDQVCKRYGTKIDEFRDPYFGPMEIYKLDWSLQAGS